MDEEEGAEAVVVTNVYGDFCIRKARRKRQKVLVREMFYDYASKTTLHGLPYTTKPGLTLTEKIFWLLTFIASVCLCCYLICNVWIKWKTSPVIVTVSEQLVSVGKVPFPSVTICPQLKCKTSVYNYTKEFKKFNELWKKKELSQVNISDYYKLDDVSNVCLTYLTLEEYFETFPRDYSNAEVVYNLVEVAPKKADVFFFCIWGHNMSADYYCAETISEVLTSEGLCYNVNSLAVNEILRLENIHKNYRYLTANKPTKNWTMEHGYSDFGPNVYPTAGKENGAEPYLQIIMKDTLIEHDDICNVLNSGFKVYVQHPADLPQSSLYYYAVLNSQVSSMALSFSILNTSETLRNYPAQTRQCYFPDERYLKYFKIYTANNCRLECLANYTFKFCDCVEFYMPHESSNQICTSQKKLCIRNAREILMEKIYNEEDDECLCLPACNSIDYEAEILKTEFHLKKLIETGSEIYNSPINVTGTNYSKLEMYFKRPRFVSMRRSELFGLTDFLANIGGLLGLFLGFSFLSLIEIIYFLSLRLCCMLKQDLKEEKIQRRNTISMPKKY